MLIQNYWIKLPQMFVRVLLCFYKIIFWRLIKVDIYTITQHNFTIAIKCICVSNLLRHFEGSLVRSSDLNVYQWGLHLTSHLIWKRNNSIQFDSGILWIISNVIILYLSGLKISSDIVGLCWVDVPPLWCIITKCIIIILMFQVKHINILQRNRTTISLANV